MDDHGLGSVRDWREIEAFAGMKADDLENPGTGPSGLKRRLEEAAIRRSMSFPEHLREWQWQMHGSFDLGPRPEPGAEQASDAGLSPDEMFDSLVNAGRDAMQSNRIEAEVEEKPKPHPG